MTFQGLFLVYGSGHCFKNKPMILSSGKWLVKYISPRCNSVTMKMTKCPGAKLLRDLQILPWEACPGSSEHDFGDSSPW